MENSEQNNQANNSLLNNVEIKSYLLETIKWGKFLAIVGYVVMEILILLGIIIMFGLSFASRFSHIDFPFGFVGFLFIIFGVTYYFPATYFYRFSTEIKQAIESNNEGVLTSGFRNLKSLFKFIGILTIVALSLCILIILIAMPLMLILRH